MDASSKHSVAVWRCAGDAEIALQHCLPLLSSGYSEKLGYNVLYWRTKLPVCVELLLSRFTNFRISLANCSVQWLVVNAQFAHLGRGESPPWRPTTRSTMASTTYAPTPRNTEKNDTREAVLSWCNTFCSWKKTRTCDVCMYVRLWIWAY